MMLHVAFGINDLAQASIVYDAVKTIPSDARAFIRPDDFIA